MLALLGLAVAAHLWATGWLTPHGHLNVDECTYHVMARAAQQGSLAFDNGYAEFATPELVWASMVPYQGALYPITPPFYAALAWPFQRALGWSGLFWMNALALLAVVGLTARLAHEMFGDRRLSAVAASVLVLATYLWEYSQGAWPHLLATLAIVAALLAAWRGQRAASDAAAWRACALAGLILGVGIGVRLDVALAAPALALPFVLAESGRRLRGLGLLLGALPPLLLLTFMNHLKFGVALPFSYGPGVSDAGDWTRYLPVALLGGAGVLLLLGLRQPRVLELLRARMGTCVAVILVAAAAVVALPELREFFARLASGVTTLAVDLRSMRSDIVRPALSRSAGDGLIYYGHLKKAWLQSLPYLGLLLVPLVAAARAHRDRSRLEPLLLLPATALLVFGYFHWDGGLSLNLRYLTPSLPCVAILVAWALREIEARRAVPALVIGAWCAAALFWWLSRSRGALPDSAELFVLDAPLVLALATTLAAGGWLLTRAQWARRIVCGFAAASLVWAGLVAFAYDYPAARWLRGYHAALSEIARAEIDADSILFTTHPDPFCGLLDVEGVRIALPANDGYRDFRALAELHLAAQRPVYAALPPAEWQRLERRGQLAGFDVERLREHPVFVIGRLRD